MPLREGDLVIFYKSDVPDIPLFGRYLCQDNTDPGYCLVVSDIATNDTFFYDEGRLISYARRFVFKSTIPIDNVCWLLVDRVFPFTLRTALDFKMSNDVIMKILEKNPGWTGLSNNVNLAMKGENNAKSCRKS